MLLVYIYGLLELELKFTEKNRINESEATYPMTLKEENALGCGICFTTGSLHECTSKQKFSVFLVSQASSFFFIVSILPRWSSSSEGSVKEMKLLLECRLTVSFQGCVGIWDGMGNLVA